jgi:MFS family permease
MAIFFFVLGGLNIGEIIVLKANYMTGLVIAVFILMLAAMVFEITKKSRRTHWIKFLYYIMWSLTGSAVAAVLFLPLLITWKIWRVDDRELMIINFGLVLFIFFCKAVGRDWKVSRQRSDLLHNSCSKGYFEELPRVMRRKKIIDIYFE